MKHIRPHTVFDRVEDPDRLSPISLPRQRSLTSMLERGILAALVKILKPQTIFEFGTYLGETTLLLAANSTGRVYTLDLDEAAFQHINSQLDGFEKTNGMNHLTNRLLFQDTEHESRITSLVGDSTTFDFAPYRRQMDFILIDGGHSEEVVRSDTDNAFLMISSDRPSCIVWHDYGNPHYRITQYLDQLSSQLPLCHVAETAYVFYIHDEKTKFNW